MAPHDPGRSSQRQQRPPLTRVTVPFAGTNQSADVVFPQSTLTTLPGQPMNLPEKKMGAMLNELEHAHIYIEELNARLAAQEALNARLIARLDALEQAD